MFDNLKKGFKPLATLLLSVAALNTASADYYYEGNDCCDGEWIDWSRLNVKAELLWWQIDNDTNAFGEKQRIVGASPEFLSRDERRISHFGHHHHFGYRVGVGYILPADNWDVNLTYTHLRDHHHKRFDSDFAVEQGGQVLNLPYFPFTAGDTSGRSRFLFEQVDLDFGRLFCVTSCLDVRPHAGFRWVHFRNKNLWNFSGVFITGTGTMKARSDYEAYGLEGGFDGVWKLGNGFAFVSKFGGAIVSGKQHLTERQELLLGGPLPIAARLKEDKDRVRGMFDLAFLLQWDANFGDCMDVILTIGWEKHVYYNQNFFRQTTFPGLAPSGDIGFTGWTFGADVLF